MNTEREPRNVECLRREALGGVNKAQLSLQRLINMLELGEVEPNPSDWNRVARHIRFAAGALEAMKGNAAPEATKASEEAAVQ